MPVLRILMINQVIWFLYKAHSILGRHGKWSYVNSQEELTIRITDYLISICGIYLSPLSMLNLPAFPKELVAASSRAPKPPKFTPGTAWRLACTESWRVLQKSSLGFTSPKNSSRLKQSSRNLSPPATGAAFPSLIGDTINYTLACDAPTGIILMQTAFPRPGQLK